MFRSKPDLYLIVKKNMWIKYHRIPVGKQEKGCVYKQKTVALPHLIQKHSKKWLHQFPQPIPTSSVNSMPKSWFPSRPKGLPWEWDVWMYKKPISKLSHVCFPMCSTCFAIVALETFSNAERWAATILQILARDKNRVQNPNFGFFPKF